ncbi:hypothetical protein IGS68_34830 (plasmid) [Skermanella sp. TT6]|uniref:Uncharacterized protein n=1 Tax=Skermanella cutis TaxID=2775420 RepID=A0ABX7BI06_9PROT|nr:hypothetical protein [Skermanella sp. TT6]QQP94020.1 hypothetical protein IGS68_34830 [Skermanella sp. TT6]
MEIDYAASRARLKRLTELLEIIRGAPHQDQARLSQTLMLVCQALQTVARVRLQIGDPGQVRQAVELEALCWKFERTALRYETRSKFRGDQL